MIADYKHRSFQWVNIFSKRDWISGPLDFYDVPSAVPGVQKVQNRADPKALVPLAAHTQYWKNHMLADELYRSI
jgi:hypothetical protein